MGGAAGSVARYLVALGINKFYNASFPLATFAVNITGCFLIGLFSGWLNRMQPGNETVRLLLVTGFCGGFTTFSAFANENFLLLKFNAFLVSMIAVTASVAGGIAAVWLGNFLTR